MRTLTDTLPWKIPAEYPLTQEKVRDIFNFGDKLLMIATDRLSAFDVVLEESPVPGRGVVLTQMTLHSLRILEDAIKQMDSPIPITHHVVSTDVADLPDVFQQHARALTGRFMLVDKCLSLPAELIVRGYIAGSLWGMYCKQREKGDGPYTILGHEFPADLLESQELSAVIFTPSTKAEQGKHDINISYDEMVDILRAWLQTHNITDIDPEVLARVCRELSLKLYTAGRDYARQRGIIIADTKFEFGLRKIDGVWHLVIIDEVLTPDSSRFWPADKYEAGRSQDSWDKQIVRDYLEKELGWDKKSPVPKLPSNIVLKTMNRYRECADLLEVEFPVKPINIMLIFGSRNDYTDDMKKAVHEARQQYCNGGPFGQIDVHVSSIHRNTYDCIALAENRIDGIDLNNIDCGIYGAGWANQLTGCLDALQYHNRQFLPVFGLAIGEDGAKEFDAARLSCECLPSHPVFLDESGESYSNADGLRAIFKRLATNGLPQVQPRKEKPSEFFIDVG